MDKYEYLKERFLRDDNELQDKLNVLGNDGWNLVEVVNYNSYEILFFFKKQTGKKVQETENKKSWIKFWR